MDFSTPFSFVFKDPNWIKKSAIAGLISLIPFVGSLYLLGWCLEVTRQIIKGENVTIPETDFGRFITRGLKAVVITIVYIFPVFLFYIPIFIGSFVITSESSDAANTAIMAISSCSGIFAAAYSILFAFVLPIVLGHFIANNEEIIVGFQFAKILTLVKKAPIAYLLVFIGSLIANMISGVGVIACVVGIVVTLPYSMLVRGHFYGQAYLEATKQ